ncbi:MAG: AMP-binding protein, partial [Alphaproteobacteria bacterium]|nr:AMP-binding protein [Alphaproteobacteria bacterium]
GAGGRRLETIEALDVIGAHLPSQLADRLRRDVTPHLRINYGASETAQVTAGDAALCITDPSAAGYCLPWADVMVVDDQDRPLPRGRDGVVRTRTAQMVSGYYRDEAATRRNFRDGWFYPGDVGMVTSDGLLRVLGRVEDRIVRDGVTISPLSIEEAIRGLPGVRDVAVFPLREGDGASEICAALVLDAAASAEAIQAGAAARLGARAPARMFRVEALPRNPNGKVLRTQLVDWAQRRTKG